MKGSLAHGLRRFAHDNVGAVALEFALIAPVFVLMIAGVFEIGMVIRAKFALTSVVSAAAVHTLSVGSMTDDAAREAAIALANLIKGGDRTAKVVVNNSVTALLENGFITVAQTGQEIANCYCASRSGDRIVWGGAVACGDPCADKSISARFVAITATSEFKQSLGMYGFFTDDELHDTAMVRLP